MVSLRKLRAVTAPHLVSNRSPDLQILILHEFLHNLWLGKSYLPFQNMQDFFHITGGAAFSGWPAALPPQRPPMVSQNASPTRADHRESKSLFQTGTAELPTPQLPGSPAVCSAEQTVPSESKPQTGISQNTPAPQ